MSASEWWRLTFLSPRMDRDPAVRLKPSPANKQTIEQTSKQTHNPNRQWEYWPGPKRSLVHTEIYPKFVKPSIQIAGPKTFNRMRHWEEIIYPTDSEANVSECSSGTETLPREKKKNKPTEHSRNKTDFKLMPGADNIEAVTLLWLVSTAEAATAIRILWREKLFCNCQRWQQHSILFWSHFMKGMDRGGVPVLVYRTTKCLLVCK